MSSRWLWRGRAVAVSEQEAYEFWDDEARRLLGLSGVAFMACLVAAGFAAFPPGARG